MPETRSVVIYGLTEPEQRWAIRYIGAARRVTRRYGQHLAHSSDVLQPRLYEWLTDLEAREALPQLVILDRAAPHEDWRALESFHIDAHRRAGFNLLNR